MEPGPTSPHAYTLRRLASIVLALISLLPLLLFVYTLYELKALGRPLAQLTLGSAVVLALIGSYIYWVMIARMSDLIRAASQRPVPVPSVAPVADTPLSVTARPASTGFEIPGMGRVGEVHAFLEPIEQLGTVWRTEAEPHVGRPVLVSVMNSTDPIAGVLLQVTNDGLLLEQAGRRVGITYRRISAIEVDHHPAERAATT